MKDREKYFAIHADWNIKRCKRKTTKRQSSSFIEHSAKQNGSESTENEEDANKNKFQYYKGDEIRKSEIPDKLLISRLNCHMSISKLSQHLDVDAETLRNVESKKKQLQSLPTSVLIKLENFIESCEN